MSPRHLALWALVLLAPSLAWADTAGVQLYESGDYEAAAQSFSQVLADAQRPPQERGEARIYLAASLHALGRTEEAQQQLELLARENPGQRVDPVLFPPELVALAEAIRQRVDTEKEYARKETERLAREEASRRPPALWLRPEILGLYELLGRQGTVGAGLSFHRGALEGSARALLNRDPSSFPPRLFPTFQLQGGALLGSGALKPHLGLRAILVPGARSYGAGAVAGLRLALPKGFVALVDVGVDRFFVTADDTYRQTAVTAQAGLGFDLQLTSGK
jgi:tetratricopeptide (TPR) repeat protein